MKCTEKKNWVEMKQKLCEKGRTTGLFLELIMVIKKYNKRTEILYQSCCFLIHFFFQKKVQRHGTEGFNKQE